MSNFVFHSEQGSMKVYGEFTLYQAQEAKSQCLEALKSGVWQSWDLSCVTEFDSCALQLLLACKVELPHLRISEHSEAVARVLGRLNIQDILHTNPTTGAMTA